jgi:hypothetical protein
MLAYDEQQVDMSQVVPGGDPDAYVVGLVIQEVDAANNVVFQWRSWDHFQITDADTCLVNLRSAFVGYTHGNAIEPDTDGNILISCRHMNEVTKINRTTGAVMWRMGLHAKQNQFSFPNDSRGWSGQHDIRRLPNGHITVFDNGNCLTPHYSRALEYQLDEVHKVATLVWEYRTTPDTFANQLGSAQRLPGGGTLIGWGGAETDPKVTEVHADGSKALELGFNSVTTWTYRAFKFPWTTTRFAVDPGTLDFGGIVLGRDSTRAITIENKSPSNLEITCFASTDSSVSVVDAVPFTISAGGSRVVTVRFAPSVNGALSGTLYVRSSNDTELVAQPVAVSGLGVPSVPIASPTGLRVLALVLLLGAGAWTARQAGGRARPVV